PRYHLRRRRCRHVTLHHRQRRLPQSLPLRPNLQPRHICVRLVPRIVRRKSKLPRFLKRQQICKHIRRHPCARRVAGRRKRRDKRREQPNAPPRSRTRHQIRRLFLTPRRTRPLKRWRQIHRGTRTNRGVPPAVIHFVVPPKLVAHRLIHHLCRRRRRERRNRQC